MLRILLIGYGELAKALLEGLLSTKHEIVGLLSWDRRKHFSRFTYNLWPDSLERLRRKAQVPALDVDSANGYKFVQIASSLEPDIILVGSWGEILKRHIIDLPKKYCINCHPSFLPFHRGSNPYASVIVQGEKFTGVTFHEIDESIDTGRIIMQQKFLTNIADTGESIRRKCAELAGSMVPTLLDDIENDRVQPKEQDNRIATYFPRIKVEDGSIDWSKPAEVINNQIRGLYPWIFCYTTYKNKFIIVKKCRLVDIEESTCEPGIILKVLDNSVLVSTSTIGKGLLLSNLEIFGLSQFFSNFYLKKLLQPNERFKNAL